MVKFSPGEVVVMLSGERCLVITGPDKDGAFKAVDGDGAIVKYPSCQVQEKEEV